MSARAKRVGRPFKPPSGKRAQLTLLVRADIKREIDKAAQKNGRTQSQEAELWFETKLTYDRAFTAMGKTPEEIQRGNLEAELFRAGYTLSRRRSTAARPGGSPGGSQAIRRSSSPERS